MSAGEVEALWKNDRFRGVLEQRCGARLLAWYDGLRTGWK